MITLETTQNSINGGIRKNDDGSYYFCKTLDLSTDLLYLNTDTSGLKKTKDLEYFYAYEFNKDATSEDIADFRHALKNRLNDVSTFDEEDIYYFVEKGLYRLDRYRPLSSFNVVVMSESSKQFSLLTLTDSILEENVDGEITTIKMIKNLCKDVIFDRDKARNALLSTDKYRGKERKVERALDKIESIFRPLQGTTKAFKMKLYVPVVARVGFTNIFSFQNKEQEELYRSLETGSNVLLVDDLITSGSTVREIKATLDAINPNINMTIFILINQLKEY